MTTCFASLISVPTKNARGLVAEAVRKPAPDYGLLLNRRELARYDGRTDDLPMLIAYRDRIYDVTGRESLNGDLDWRQYAGKDCTVDLRAHWRRHSWLVTLPCVGFLED